jgi:hypothetical protein
VAETVLGLEAGALSSTGMRYHELALQHWLNANFLLRWGVPIPVIFSNPMDAFSEFTLEWSRDQNAYQYLLDVKDDIGTPLYLPHPSPIRYPLISVYRRNYKLRQSHNFSIHNMRHIEWPTVSDAGTHVYGKEQHGVNLEVGDLGMVTVTRYPMAVDFKFQVDFFCNRPDTQAFFLRQLFKQFWRTGGPQLQTWTLVKYPILGPKLVRLYLDGEVENTTPETPEDGKNQEFRVTISLVLEGYEIDVDYKLYPALWKIVTRSGAITPLKIAGEFGIDNSQVDYFRVDSMRDTPESNPTVAYRMETAVMPASGTFATDTSGTFNGTF